MSDLLDEFKAIQRQLDESMNKVQELLIKADRKPVLKVEPVRFCTVKICTDFAVKQDGNNHWYCLNHYRAAFAHPESNSHEVVAFWKDGRERVDAIGDEEWCRGYAEMLNERITDGHVRWLVRLREK